jgi:hypothetical protein
LSLTLVMVFRAPDLDMQVRWCLLKLCDVLVRPSNEPIPKLRFPQQLVAEQAQPWPKIRLVNPAPERQRNLALGAHSPRFPCRYSITYNGSQKISDLRLAKNLLSSLCRFSHRGGRASQGSRPRYPSLSGRACRTETCWPASESMSRSGTRMRTASSILLLVSVSLSLDGRLSVRGGFR